MKRKEALLFNTVLNIGQTSAISEQPTEYGQNVLVVIKVRSSQKRCAEYKSLHKYHSKTNDSDI